MSRDLDPAPRRNASGERPASPVPAGMRRTVPLHRSMRPRLPTYRHDYQARRSPARVPDQRSGMPGEARTGHTVVLANGYARVFSRKIQFSPFWEPENVPFLQYEKRNRDIVKLILWPVLRLTLSLSFLYRQYGQSIPPRTHDWRI